MNAYTLFVEDQDKIIVESRAIELKGNVNDVEIGQGIDHYLTSFPFLSVYSTYRLTEAKLFKLWPCHTEPTNTIQKNRALYIWERIE